MFKKLHTIKQDVTENEMPEKKENRISFITIFPFFYYFHFPFQAQKICMQKEEAARPSLLAISIKKDVMKN